MKDSHGDLLDARVHNLDEILLVVADVELTVDVTLGAIVVNLNGESLGAVAGEGVKNGLAGNGNTTEILTFFPDDIQPSGEGAAVAVGLSSDGEVKGPAVFGTLNGSGAVEAEVNNIDLAVESVLNNVAGSLSSLVLNGTDVLPENVGLGGTS